ncbi:hypothetical protein NQ318_007920 [Aromia moschata]|uniref:Uncharacterized protein n=1 Tax=Aromia moschata TaxID=1265417 RepID=A0AAV8Y0K5_9CUCU|nr:hypothetical protein NQ318_007920 [Aromia moschata]
MFLKLACLWITEVIQVLVQCAQLKELLLLPKVIHCRTRLNLASRGFLGSMITNMMSEIDPDEPGDQVPCSPRPIPEVFPQIRPETK